MQKVNARSIPIYSVYLATFEESFIFGAPFGRVWAPMAPKLYVAGGLQIRSWEKQPLKVLKGLFRFISDYLFIYIRFDLCLTYRPIQVCIRLDSIVMSASSEWAQVTKIPSQQVIKTIIN